MAQDRFLALASDGTRKYILAADNIEVFTNDASAVAVGDWVYADADDHVAKASSSAAQDAVGVVISTIDTTNCRVLCRGIAEGVLSGATAGAPYFLGATAGTIAATVPVAATARIQIVGFALNTTDLLVAPTSQRFVKATTSAGRVVTWDGTNKFELSDTLTGLAALTASGIVSAGSLTLTSSGITMTGFDIGSVGAEIGSLFVGQADQDGIRLADVANAPTAATDKGWIYSKSVSGNSELFWVDDGAVEVQITAGGVLSQTLDSAYDSGGLGSGRTINVTNSAVQMLSGTGYGAAYNVLEIQTGTLAQVGTGLNISLPAGAYTAEQKGLEIDFSGATSITDAGANDSYGINLKGITQGDETTGGESIGIRIDAGFDVAMYLGEMGTPAPDTPPAGFIAFYAKTDGALYVKDSGGTETNLLTGTTPTLNGAYDSGGPGSGRIITADSGAVQIDASGTGSYTALDISLDTIDQDVVGIQLSLGTLDNYTGNVEGIDISFTTATTLNNASDCHGIYMVGETNAHATGLSIGVASYVFDVGFLAENDILTKNSIGFHALLEPGSAFTAEQTGIQVDFSQAASLTDAGSNSSYGINLLGIAQTTGTSYGLNIDGGWDQGLAITSGTAKTAAYTLAGVTIADLDQKGTALSVAMASGTYTAEQVGILVDFSGATSITDAGGLDSYGINLVGEPQTTGDTVALRIDENWDVGLEVFQNVVHFGTLLSDASPGATPTIDFSECNKKRIVLSANVTSITLTNPPGVTSVTLIIKQPAAGGPHTVTGWPSTVKWFGGTAYTATASADAVDVVAGIWDGTDYHLGFGLDSKLPA